MNNTGEMEINMRNKQIANKMFNKESMLLYAVTDRQWLDGKSFEEEIEAVLKSGVTFLQLREKNMSYDELVAEGKVIKKIADKYNVPFVIDDDIYAAKEIDADGVHIGQSDMEYEKARKILGDDKIIGVTAPTPELAIKAQEAGADYIGVGAVFHTTTKKDAKDMKKETLLDITSRVDIPVVAIGGINYDNVDRLSGTGVDGVAVISAIFAQKDVAAATERLLRKVSAIDFKEDNIKLPDNIRYAIFDMDGTILNSMPYWDNLLRNYITSKGYTVTEEVERKAAAMTVKEAVAYVKDIFNIDVPTGDIEKSLIDIIKRQYKEEIPAKKRTVDIIKELHKQNIKMCILTSSDYDCAVEAIKRNGLSECFDNIFTSDRLKMSKRDPDIYRETAKRMGFDITKTVVFEDAMHGVSSAKNAGFYVVAVYDTASQADWDKIKDLADVHIYS